MSSPGFAADDLTFLQTAIGVNLAEIQMGKLAGSKSPTDAVRSFGATLVTDHKKANDDAVALAKKMNVEVPTAPSTDAQAEYDRIAKLSGQQFDKAFADAMVDGHKKAINYFADKADDAASDVTAYAERTLPVLRKHLETAQSLQSGSADGHAVAGQQDDVGPDRHARSGLRRTTTRCRQRIVRKPIGPPQRRTATPCSSLRPAAPGLVPT